MQFMACTINPNIPTKPYIQLLTKPLAAAIQQRVTAVLRSISKEAFADSFQKLYERCQPCIVKDGDYLYLLFCLFSGTIHRTF
jgi:hypothetical protein